MILTRAKRLLSDKELEIYLKLDNQTKQKKYLENLYKELFEQYEWRRGK